MADETEVGRIVAYLNLVRSDWSRGVKATEADAQKLSQLSPDIKIRTNAAAVIAQLDAVKAAENRVSDAQARVEITQTRLTEAQKKYKEGSSQLAAAEAAAAKAIRDRDQAQLNLSNAVRSADLAQQRLTAAMAKSRAETEKLGQDAEKTGQKVKFSLVGALAALAPAAVPIAAVAGGALAGLIPVVATVALGIKGITAAEKDGSLAGTKYGDDLAKLSAEGQKLQQIAAGGLLSGIDRGLASAHGLFGVVNQDVSVMSGQLGDIIAGAGPALVKILTQLDPLFVTIGNDLSKGAASLEHWATSSDGVSKFVGYVQAELPTVEHLIGNLIVLLSHLAQGAAPFGGVLLTDITLFVKALDSIPVGVLKTAIPLAVSLYAAFKAYAIITAIVNRVSGAVTALGNALGLTGPKAEAAAAEHKAAMLSIQADAAATARDVALAEAQKAEDTAAASADIAASLDEVDSALAGEALAASEAATEFAAAMRAEAVAATTTAETIAAEAQGAADASRIAGAEAGAGWSAMLGPIGAVLIGGGLLATMFLHTGQAAQQMQQEVDSLTDAIKQDSGAIGENTKALVVQALQQAGALDDARKLGVSLPLVRQAALGNKDALDKVTQAIGLYTYGTYGQTKSTHDQVAAAKDLLKILGDQSSAVGKASQAYKNEQAALGGSTHATKTAAAAARDLNQALETLQQTELAAAQSEDQFREAVRGVTTQLDKNNGSLSKHTAHGLANRDAFLNAASAALSYKDAQVKAGVSTDAANKKLADNITQLEQAAIKAGADKDQVHALLGQMDLLPSQIRTAIILTGTGSAMQKLHELLGLIPSGTYHFNVEADYRKKEASFPHRAMGGSVVGGMPYVVGDAGKPEIFVPSASGRVISGRDAAQAAANGRRSSDKPPVQVTVYAPQSLDPEAAGWAVGRHVQATVGVAV